MMTGNERPGAEVPGRTTISSRALHRMAVGLVADEGHVAGRDVVVSLGDEAGSLAVSITLPAVVGGIENTSLVERGAGLRAAVTRGMDALAARRVGSVSVRFEGVRRQRKRRVS